MTSATKLLIACFALTLPVTAFAQSADAKYCQALADDVAKCQAGDTSGIPVIERALKDAKVELPPRN
jgi:hypothetical protein